MSLAVSFLSPSFLDNSRAIPGSTLSKHDEMSVSTIDKGDFVRIEASNSSFFFIRHEVTIFSTRPPC